MLLIDIKKKKKKEEEEEVLVTGAEGIWLKCLNEQPMWIFVGYAKIFVF